jgi:uncharacterized repeat protein (TIGR02543 family)
MRNSTKKITAIAAALLLSVSGVATTAAMAAPAFAVTAGDLLKVTFDSMGGSDVASQNIEFAVGATATEPTTPPTKTGYNFVGWYDNAACTGEAYSFATVLTGNLTLYAKWEKATAVDIASAIYNEGSVTVKLNSAADVNAKYLVAVTYGNHTYTKQGVEGSTLKNSGLAITFATNSSYEFIDTDVVAASALDVSKIAPQAGEKITVKVYKQAYTSATDYVVATTNMTAVATKSITVGDVFYTVTLNTNGGTLDETEVRVAVNDAYEDAVAGSDGNAEFDLSGQTTANNPTKKGYIFEGWYTDAALTKKLVLTDAPSEDVTLYAKWRAFNKAVSVTNIGYAATVSAGVQALNGATTDATVDKTNTFWAKLDFAPEAASTSNQYFLVEVTVNGTTYSKVITPDGNIDALTIALGSGASVDFINGEFAEAFTTKTAPVLNDGDTATVKVSSFTLATYSDSTTTYAQITAAKPTVLKTETVTIKKNYTVTFDTQGGSDVSAATVTSSAKVGKPNDPTRAGYDFTGWYTDAACTTAYDFTKTVTADITLYAGWTMSANNIAGATIATIANVAYTGEAQTPALKVTLGDKELVEGTDYTVEYTNNTEVGCATATITGIGAYTGTNARNFVIVPQQVTGLKAVKKTATTLKLQFNAVEGADGYKIYDAETGKAIASVSTQNGADVLKKTITGLNAGETRKYKVRAYKIVNGTKRYAEYSAVYTKATAKK